MAAPERLSARSITPEYRRAHPSRRLREADTARVMAAVELAREGDRDALGFLYARYSEDVCSFVRSIVRDPHEAEDITQQVFAKLMQILHKYEEREVPFLAWVLRVARNMAIDSLRRKRLVPVEDVRLSDDADHPGSRHHVEHLTEALSQLPVDQREVLVLRHFAGLSPSEIASHTGRTEGSIHGLHHRGRAALRAELTRLGSAPTVKPSRPRLS